MLFSLLMTFYAINCTLLVLIIMIQQGKGGLGLGALGGASQMMFGGSGGADLFQKITWTLGAIFMFGSLALALMRSQTYRTGSLVRQRAPIQQPLAPQPQQAPAEAPSDAAQEPTA